MLLFSFFHKNQKAQHKSSSLLGGYQHTAIPGEPQEVSQKYEYDPTIDNDLCYEDALLDSQMRQFMREEYRQIEPPAGVFKRVLKAIETASAIGCGRSTSKQTLLNRSFFNAFRSALTGQTAMRALPSGFAMVLALSIGLSANMGHITGANTSSSQYSSLVSPTAQIAYEIAPGQASYPATQELVAALPDDSYNAIAIDPYELLTPRRRGSDNTHLSREYADDRIQYEHKNFTPQ